MIIAPMLAKLHEPGTRPPNWPAEKKENGIRTLLYLEPHGNTALTRVKGKHTDTCGDKSLHIPWLQAIKVETTVVLDGEFKWGRNHSDCMSVLGCEWEEAQVRQVGNPVRFVAWDVPFFGKSLCDLMPQMYRFQTLGAFLQRLNHPYVQLVETRPAGLTNEQWLKQVLKAGGEGIMLKDPHGKYEPGRRSPAWLKLKGERTFHVAVLRATAGKAGKTDQMVGLMGALQVGIWDEKLGMINMGHVGTGFDLGEAERGMYAFKLREVIEVKCAELTDDGKLQHGRFIRRVPEKTFRETGEVGAHG